MAEIFDCYKIINGDKMKIETERLYLRELTHKNFDALYKVLADSDIMQHYPYTFDESRVQNWINGNIERYKFSALDCGRSV